MADTAPRRASGLLGASVTALRWAVVVPIATVLSVLLMVLPVRDAPGVGGDSLACALMMDVAPPMNVWAFAVVAGLGLSGSAVALDLVCARLVGGFGRGATVGLGVTLLVAVVAGLVWADVGIFC